MKVSIVIPCFNRAEFVGEAIESALSEGADVEVMVIDDGSDDGSADVIGRYSQVISLRTANRGPSAARNLGISKSRGAYLRFLDSDDRIIKGSTACLLKSSQGPGSLTIPVGDAESIDASGANLPSCGYGFGSSPIGALSRATVLGSVMVSWLPLYPTELLRSLGGFDERLRISEDQELAIRALAAGAKFNRVGVPSVEVREHSSMRLSRSGDARFYDAQITSFSTMWQVIRSFDPPSNQRERSAFAKLIWIVARDASRNGFGVQAQALFALATSVGGAGAIAGSAPVRLLSRVLGGYRTEQVAQVLKALIGRG